MKKIIALIVVIIISLLGALGIGLYNHNVYYSPVEENDGGYASAYKEYITAKTFIAKDNKEEQTEDRIEVFQNISEEYLSEEPIFVQDVEKNGKKLFKIAIYKNAVQYAPNADTNEVKYRINTFIYSVNYDAIKEMFLSQQVPQDKTELKTITPTIVINFFPNEECVEEESLFYSTRNTLNVITLNDGTEIRRSELNSHTNLNLLDWNSTPSYNKDEEPFKVNFFGFNVYPNSDYSQNFAMFNDSAYIKVEAIAKASEVTYGLEEELLKAKVENFDLTKEINVEDYRLACNTSTDVETVLANISSVLEKNLNISGILTYNQWVFTNYTWWQCLIAFVVVFLIAGGFAYSYTVDTNDKKTRKK